MDWKTELHHGYAYTIGYAAEGGQQSKQPVVILRKDLTHAEETRKALEEVEARQLEREREREAQAGLGEADLSGIPFNGGGGRVEMGAPGWGLPDMFSSLG